MDFRFQEPETKVEATEWHVHATLEDQTATITVQRRPGYCPSIDGSNQPLELSVEQLWDRARERACRVVKAKVLERAAQRVRSGQSTY